MKLVNPKDKGYKVGYWIGYNIIGYILLPIVLPICFVYFKTMYYIGKYFHNKEVGTI